MKGIIVRKRTEDRAHFGSPLARMLRTVRRLPPWLALATALFLIVASFLELLPNPTRDLEQEWVARATSENREACRQLGFEPETAAHVRCTEGLREMRARDHIELIQM